MNIQHVEIFVGLCNTRQFLHKEYTLCYKCIQILNDIIILIKRVYAVCLRMSRLRASYARLLRIMCEFRGYILRNINYRNRRTQSSFA